MVMNIDKRKVGVVALLATATLLVGIAIGVAVRAANCVGISIVQAVDVFRPAVLGLVSVLLAFLAGRKFRPKEE